MIDDDGGACLIDLGLSVHVPPPKGGGGEGTVRQRLVPRHCRHGKQSYVSPEMVEEGVVAYDPYAADMWSLGICLYVMLTGCPLYNSPQDVSFHLMAQGRVEEVITAYEGYGLVLPPRAKRLLCGMLDKDPLRRPTLEEVLLHEFTVGKGQ